MDQIKQKFRDTGISAKEDEETSLAEAYYQLIRHGSYTWEELMREKAPRTFFSLDMLAEEARERKEHQEELESDVSDAKSKMKRMN